VDAGPVSERQKASAGRNLKHGLVYLALLVLLVAGLLLAIPGLHGVGSAITHMEASWLVAGVGLELLSCLSYVLAFLRVFEQCPPRISAPVALSELAFGAAVSLGGAGSIAIGSWLLIERGAPPARVIERSAVLFLLTSAVNVITLVVVGFGLFAGVLTGPQLPLLTIVPASIGLAVFLGFLLLTGVAERLAEQRPEGRARTVLTELAASIRDTRQLLLAPDWRLLGAIGYLWFDIGVLVTCFAALGEVPPLAPIILAYQLGYLADVIPVPGGVGVVDASLVGLLVLFGVNATDATAATLVYHAIALWVPAVLGTAAFLSLRRGRGGRIELAG
jgi:uncharacterized membrane protein YbhN (UPF0104 family)